MPPRFVMLNGQYIRVSTFFMDVPSVEWQRNFPLRERVGDLICAVIRSTGALPVLDDYLWVAIDKNSMLSFRVSRRTFVLAEEADMTTEGILPDLIVQYAVVPLPAPSEEMPQLK